MTDAAKDAATAKAERLSAALRDNLKRRKAQAREAAPLDLRDQPKDLRSS